ncbi:MAG TPA: hypothetical protein VF615_11305 [Longimicrobiaceae bacterium]|jgi:phage-related minor tail protein
MHSFSTLPVPGGAAAVALAARSTSLGTVIVAVIAIVFVGLIVVGSRPSVMARYRDGDAADGAPEGRDRRQAAP